MKNKQILKSRTSLDDINGTSFVHHFANLSGVVRDQLDWLWAQLDWAICCELLFLAKLRER